MPISFDAKSSVGIAVDDVMLAIGAEVFLPVDKLMSQYCKPMTVVAAAVVVVAGDVVVAAAVSFDDYHRNLFHVY